MKKRGRTHPIRTVFARDIIADVFLPDRQTGKIAILAGGLPSSPSKNDVLQFLSASGYVAIFFRYRGSWESRGNFLKQSPTRDIKDIIDDLEGKKKIHDILLQTDISIRVSAFSLFGSSFGGPAVILNSGNPLVKKVIALSPVLDWQELEKSDEPLAPYVRFLEAGYPGAYRVKSPRDWKKLLRSDFYNPMTSDDPIIGKKILILHALDDTNVPFDAVIPFAHTTKATYYLKPHGGHFGLRHITHQFFWKKIKKFLDT
ncbi:MAG: hypothetical protein COZ29_01755 [Candidatus Moranbacteria bacterium CG_4_10_14_3_um_filter_45_9]|nr:MAG: hypothetical protein AUK19_02145 [Candidatus Moranbacteria bacterium CG2_30_45_14]PIX90096.1 MAG: hypothetical protein COZ29_01755 [Candidatus Moranbacteria bacterium CG_4_10_14_3_um_filter_45_9]PJA85766.1 MAG: hypothetical protein CO143_00955 [Candidatus Moranbacteria bacterium CG_4_9_14_3_um_filter_45_14]